VADAELVKSRGQIGAKDHGLSSQDRSRYIDSLRLSQREEEALMEQLDLESHAARGADLRRDERLPYRCSSGMIVTLEHPGGSVANYLVRPRNLSRHGVGFLHGNFIHQGSHCKLHLLKLDGTPHVLEGCVVRCRHISGLVHEIGVRLDDAVDMGSFIRIAEEGSDQTENSIELPQLAGVVLYVGSSEDDRRLLQFHLNSLGVDLALASEALPALELIRSRRFDLVILEARLSGMTGPELAVLLRGEGFKRPILLVQDHGADAGGHAAVPSGCTDVLGKPLTLELVLRTLEQHLVASAREDDSCLYSANWSRSAERPRILFGLGRIEEQVRRLDECARESAAADIERLAPDLASLATAHGYPDIARLATEMARIGAGGGSIEDVRGTLAELRELTSLACAVVHRT